MGAGEEAMGRGRIRRAIVCFEKEIELNPKNPAPYLKLALLYEVVRKDPEKAAAYYEQYFKRETNEAKRERVEAWRSDLVGAPPEFELSSVPSVSTETPTTGHAELARKLAEATRANEAFAARIIELEALVDELDAAKAAAADLKKERDALKQARASLETAVASLTDKHEALIKSSSAKIARLNKRIAQLEAGRAPTTVTRTHTVQQGETLMLIALQYYGTKDRWREIYEANRSTIPNPNEIKAGQELIIPLDETP